MSLLGHVAWIGQTGPVPAVSDHPRPGPVVLSVTVRRRYAAGGDPHSSGVEVAFSVSTQTVWSLP